MEENDHNMEPQQGQFIDGTPSREVLLRVNHNNDREVIGDNNGVNSCTQDSLRTILQEIKSLKSQMNSLQNRVQPTIGDNQQMNQNNERFYTTNENDQTRNIYQPYRSSSMQNYEDESRN